MPPRNRAHKSHTSSNVPCVVNLNTVHGSHPNNGFKIEPQMCTVLPNTQTLPLPPFVLKIHPCFYSRIEWTTSPGKTASGPYSPSFRECGKATHSTSGFLHCSDPSTHAETGVLNFSLTTLLFDFLYRSRGRRGFVLELWLHTVRRRKLPEGLV